MTSATSVDSLTNIGTYKIGSLSDNPFGAGYTAILYVSKLEESSQPYIRQVAVRNVNGVDCCKIRWYWGGSWTVWKDNAIDYPTFYKDYANLSALASALGAADYLTQGDFSDFNNIPHNSFATIFITSTAQNAPIEAYVSGIQLYYNSNKVIQIVFEYFSNDKIYVRQKTNNDWSDWKYLTLT